MAITGAVLACKSKEKAVEPQNGGEVTQRQASHATTKTMPVGRLLRVSYSHQGMMMERFSHFDLQHTAEGNKFSFRHFSDEVSYEVSDTLFDAARRIIEEERMFEYESYYGLPPELEQRMLDGFRWRFDACFENGERIHSSGRHVFPDGNGLQKIERLLYHAAEAATKATLDDE
jgi:hypothetical protein